MKRMAMRILGIAALGAAATAIGCSSAPAEEGVGTNSDAVYIKGCPPGAIIANVRIRKRAYLAQIDSASFGPAERLDEQKYVGQADPVYGFFYQPKMGPLLRCTKKGDPDPTPPTDPAPPGPGGGLETQDAPPVGSHVEDYSNYFHTIGNEAEPPDGNFCLLGSTPMGIPAMSTGQMSNDWGGRRADRARYAIGIIDYLRASDDDGAETIGTGAFRPAKRPNDPQSAVAMRWVKPLPEQTSKVCNPSSN
jgi:hypothetical protein